MEGLSALFLKIPMSRAAFARWIAAPLKRLGDYDDWREMNPVMEARFDEWREAFNSFGHETIGAWLDAATERSEFFCCEYDDEERALFLADAVQDASLFEIAPTLAVLRSAEAFADEEAAGYIYVYPAVTGGDPVALMKIERGSSKFLPSGDTSPEVLFFISEAEEFIEALLEDEDMEREGKI